MESSERLLPLLLQQTRDHALILLDPRGFVVGWLAGSEHIFGYSAEGMVGQPIHKLFTPEDVERKLSDHELEVARKDGRAEDDRWQVRKDGTRIWASGVVIALRNEEGDVVGFGKILRDRTDIKGQIEALEKRAESLKRADERKDVFLGTLAHELRNPLAPLVNALHLIRATGFSDDLAYPVKMIERQVEFIRRLVDDLLDVTRIGTGKVRLQLAPVELNEILTRVADTARPRYEAKRQQLRVLLPGPIWLEADSARVEQVFVNLLNNAVKYTPEGGMIWLKATIEGKEAVVRVEDTVVGISGEMLPRIFDLFTQEKTSLGRSEGGLGLGLPLVRDLVELHGGTVQVRSEGKNKGSEFTVRLPLRAGGSP